MPCCALTCAQAVSRATRAHAVLRPRSPRPASLSSSHLVIVSSCVLDIVSSYVILQITSSLTLCAVSRHRSALAILQITSSLTCVAHAVSRHRSALAILQITSSLTLCPSLVLFMPYRVIVALLPCCKLLRLFSYVCHVSPPLLPSYRLLSYAVSPSAKIPSRHKNPVSSFHRVLFQWLLCPPHQFTMHR